MNAFVEIKELLKIIVLSFLVAIIMPRGVFASDMGPFNVAPIGLGEMFRETPQFVSPTDHKEGRVQVNISARWLNVWAYNMASDPSYEWENPPDDFPLSHGNFLMDMDSFSLTHRISLKASDRVCAEITIPVVYQTGSFGDNFINNFHKTLGIDHNHRDKWPRNEVNGYYVTKDSELENFSDDIHGVFLGNIIIGGTYLVRSTFPKIGVRALCKLPTSTMEDTFDQNGVDLTFQASTTWNRKKFYGHHGLGVTFYGSSGMKDLNLNGERFSIFSAIEYSWSNKISLIAQLVTATCAADSPKLDDPIMEVMIGFKKKLGPGTLEFCLIENVLYFDNSPDGGVHIGYTFSK